MRGLHKRLTTLENVNQQAQEQGQTTERFSSDGEEYVQIYWDGKPSGRPMLAWMWDAWPNQETTGELTQ